MNGYPGMVQSQQDYNQQRERHRPRTAEEMLQDRLVAVLEWLAKTTPEAIAAKEAEAARLRAALQALGVDSEVFK